MGADHVTASGLLNEVPGRVRAGPVLVAGEVLDFVEWGYENVDWIQPRPDAYRA